MSDTKAVSFCDNHSGKFKFAYFLIILTFIVVLGILAYQIYMKFGGNQKNENGQQAYNNGTGGMNNGAGNNSTVKENTATTRGKNGGGGNIEGGNIKEENIGGGGNIGGGNIEVKLAGDGESAAAQPTATQEFLGNPYF